MGNIKEIKICNDIKYTFDEWQKLEIEEKKEFKRKVLLLIYHEEIKSWTKIWDKEYLYIFLIDKMSNHCENEELQKQIKFEMSKDLKDLYLQTIKDTLIEKYYQTTFEFKDHMIIFKYKNEKYKILREYLDKKVADGIKPYLINQYWNDIKAYHIYFINLKEHLLKPYSV
ncbi:3317_t:CDS:2 [Scutellospora calospora]|uniref:3317_t:CDS:1 n=1 Tax=Scutellospora calospora TaxID=85575 RepID=A0ACA9K9F6_9GLOM|nr:3317_t:CDS:2 [Scutellospora calospora]